MIVSDLLRYRDDLKNKLNQLDLVSPLDQANLTLDQLLSTHTVDFSQDKILSVKNSINQFIKEAAILKDQLASIEQDLDNTIDNLVPRLHPNASVDFFHQYFKTDLIVDDTVNNTVQAKLHSNADWHYPALQLGCRPHSKILTSELVSNDPLYLCDFDSAYVDNVADQFNDIYSKRIRRYVIQNHDLSILPQNQFGFVFSWLWFNYTSMNSLYQYLDKVLNLLRPGGHFLFSYNNCDILDSCLLAERSGMSYMSKRKITEVCLNYGYEIVEFVDLPNNDREVPWISWAEIKKPGELTTVKLSQVMGAIHHK